MLMHGINLRYLRLAARKIDMSLGDQIVDVARHDDRYAELIVECKSRAGYHRSGLAALDATVDETGRRPVRRGRAQEIAAGCNTIGRHYGVYDVRSVADRISALTALETERIKGAREIWTIENHDSAV